MPFLLLNNINVNCIHLDDHINIDIKINLATMKSYKMKKHKKHQISILQTNGSLVTFLFESSPINDFVTALKTLLHTEK